MSKTMRQIAKDIDLLYPPESLRKLAARFRYPGLTVGHVPQAGISLRELERRVGGPDGKRLEFLHYNTYLLHCDIPLADFIDPLGGMHNFLYAIGADLVKQTVIKYLELVGSEQVCDALFPPIVEVCGVSVNPLNDACRAFGLVADVATWLLDRLGDAFDTIFDLLSVPLDLVLSLTLEVLGMDPVIQIKSASDIGDRAVEIGSRLSTYDLVSLCEVWQDEHRRPLLAQVQHGDCFLGPPGPQPGDWRQMGSGLLVFSPSLLEIVNGGTCEYSTTGICRTPSVFDFGPFVDADRWSCKGIQLTLVPIPGLGTLEIYSTHTYSGGDMGEPFYTLFGGEPSAWEKALVRELQIFQLAQYVKDTHQADRVAIIVGDFNVAPYERHEWPSKGSGWPEGYFPDEQKHLGLCDQLRRVDEGLEFDDWYSLTMFTSVYPSVYTDLDNQGNPKAADPEDWGHTNRSGSSGFINFDHYCPAYAAAARGFPSPAPGDYYCDESLIVWSQATGYRIDYVFVQRPVAAHGYHLDLSRIRRRAFPRTGSWIDEPYLSDHVGLELTLFASPK